MGPPVVSDIVPDFGGAGHRGPGPWRWAIIWLRKNASGAGLDYAEPLVGPPPPLRPGAGRRQELVAGRDDRPPEPTRGLGARRLRHQRRRVRGIHRVQQPYPAELPTP